jgi:transcriptional regulator with XRE-family HTH domain
MSTNEAYRAELDLLLKEFAKNVKRLREAKEPGYSQEDLSADSELDRTSIGNFEQGRSDPHMSTLLILADALGVTVNDLLAGLPIPNERRPSKKPRRRRVARQPVTAPRSDS